VRTLLKSKIHRATVTETNLDYDGSITIDRELMRDADILPYEKVEVMNVNTGARFETYAVGGSQGEITLNGACARLAEVGDIVIILAYAILSEADLPSCHCNVVQVDKDNNIRAVLGK